MRGRGHQYHLRPRSRPRAQRRQVWRQQGRRQVIVIVWMKPAVRHLAWLQQWLQHLGPAAVGHWVANCALLPLRRAAILLSGWPVQRRWQRWIPPANTNRLARSITTWLYPLKVGRRHLRAGLATRIVIVRNLLIMWWASGLDLNTRPAASRPRKRRYYRPPVCL